MRRFLTALVLGTALSVFTGQVWAQEGGSPPSPFQLTPGAMATMSDHHGGQSSFLKWVSGVEASGFINVGYAYNFQDSERSTNVPGAVPANPTGAETPFRVFDTFHNEFTVHQAILHLRKDANEDNLVGFELTPMLGKDTSLTQEANISFAGGTDVDILAANIQVYTPSDVPLLAGTTFTLGKFVRRAGAEVIESPYNDNVSRSLMSSFMIPYTHTGIFADRTIWAGDDDREIVGFGGGIVNGWGQHNVGNSVNNGNFPTYLTSTRVSPCEGFTTTVNYLFGETIGSGVYRNLLDVVMAFELLEDTTLLLNGDWRGDQGASLRDTHFASTYAFAGVLRQDFQMIGSENKDSYLAVRGEFYDDEHGATLLGVVPTTSGTGALTELEIWSVTATLGWQPLASLLLRSEVRYDMANHKVYESGDSAGQVTLGFDATYLF